jgi:K+-sensing histidine kinase KdpD
MTTTTDFHDVRGYAKRTKVLHDRNFWEIREILVPIDLKVKTRQVIASAVSLARRWNAHLTLLHVYVRAERAFPIFRVADSRTADGA